MSANARYRTRTPKGIFFYDDPEQMNRDRERWTVALLISRQAGRASPARHPVRAGSAGDSGSGPTERE